MDKEAIQLPVKRRSHNDVYQGEIVRSLRLAGAYTRSSVTGKYSQTDPGSADLFVLINGLGCAVEIKTGYNNSFSFSEWRENQRLWAKDFIAQTHCEYWMALVVETEYSLWRVPRCAFLIPYSYLISAEAYSPIGSLPYQAGKGSRVEMQENNLDMQFLWKGNELIWNKGHWEIPFSSLFYQTYMRK